METTTYSIIHRVYVVFYMENREENGNYRNCRVSIEIIWGLNWGIYWGFDRDNGKGNGNSYNRVI